MMGELDRALKEEYMSKRKQREKARTRTSSVKVGLLRKAEKLDKGGEIDGKHRGPPKKRPTYPRGTGVQTRIVHVPEVKLQPKKARSSN